jgi:hypothetical protein
VAKPCFVLLEFVHPFFVGGDSVISFVLCCAAVDESLHGDVSIALESPDQNTREFVFQIALSQ